MGSPEHGSFSLRLFPYLLHEGRRLAGESRNNAEARFEETQADQIRYECRETEGTLGDRV